MEQKETDRGKKDDPCNRYIESAGLCRYSAHDRQWSVPVLKGLHIRRLHYKEYLGDLIWKNNIDPIDIFSDDELELVLQRENIRRPPRSYTNRKEEREQFKKQLIEVCNSCRLCGLLVFYSRSFSTNCLSIRIQRLNKVELSKAPAKGKRENTLGSSFWFLKSGYFSQKLASSSKFVAPMTGWRSSTESTFFRPPSLIFSLLIISFGRCLSIILLLFVIN